MIYILGIGLLYTSFKQNNYLFFHGPQKEFHLIDKIIKTQYQNMREQFNNKDNAGLLMALTMGEKRWIAKDIKKDFRTLGMTHIFTPSGLHLASALYFFHFLSRKKRQKYEWITLNFLLLLFFIPGFFAMKRILAIRYINLFFEKYTKIKIDLFFIFIIVFTFDYFWGSFNENPISHALSFIFVGSIYALKSDITPGIMAKNFLFLGLLVNYFFEIPTSLVGHATGILFTAIFSFIYPFFLLSFITLKIPYEFFLDIILKATNFLSEFAKNFDFVFLSFPLFIFSFYYLIFHRRINYKFLNILGILLIFHCNPIVNLPSSVRFTKYLESDAPIYNLDVVNSKYTTNSIVIDYEKNIRCHIKIRNHDYYRQCDLLKRPSKKAI